VDDHPENNASIFALLRQFGTTIDTPHANDAAIELLRHNSDYDVIISDVARDAEGPGSDLKGVEFAKAVFQQWGRKTILFSARFNPLTVPGRSVEERLELAREVQSTVFGTTGRY
jgi:CheY-like chemotaxis protein